MQLSIKKILLQGALLLGACATAQAAPFLVVSNGILMGAKGVEVAGQQYDVLFSDARPQSDSLVFDTYDKSYAASLALDQLVFQGIYDTSPRATNGCNNPLSCAIVTAYDVGHVAVNGTAFSNTASRNLDFSTYYLVMGNGASSALVTYANWSRQILQPPRQEAVPEPSTLLLAGAGLAAFLVRRKARRGVA